MHANAPAPLIEKMMHAIVDIEILAGVNCPVLGTVVGARQVEWPMEVHEAPCRATFAPFCREPQRDRQSNGRASALCRQHDHVIGRSESLKPPRRTWPPAAMPRVVSIPWGGDEKSFANPSSEQPTRRVGVPGPVGSHMACGTTIPWKTPPMELRQLRYFVKVVEHGSFSQAAAALGVVTSALSQQISRLEGELSTRLLQRTSKGVLPTDAGLAFWRQAQLALRHADHAVLAAQGWSVLPLLQERLCAMGLRGLPGPPTTAQPAGQFVGRRTVPRRAGHPRGVDRGGSFAGGRGPLDRRLVSRILKPPCRDRSGGQPAACLQCRQA